MWMKCFFSEITLDSSEICFVAMRAMREVIWTQTDQGQLSEKKTKTD
jgi:hypothetical protein